MLKSRTDLKHQGPETIYQAFSNSGCNLRISKNRIQHLKEKKGSAEILLCPLREQHWQQHLSGEEIKQKLKQQGRREKNNDKNKLT